MSTLFVRKSNMLLLLICLSFFLFSSTGFAQEKVVEEKEVEEKLMEEEEKVEQEPAVPKFTTIKFDKKEINFGDIDMNIQVQDVFRFTNTGKAPLVIKNVTGSCGCTIPIWSDDPIAPGESGEITVEFNSKGKIAAQDQHIAIEANVASGTTYLFVKAYVLVPMAANSWGVVDKKEQQEEVVEEVAVEEKPEVKSPAPETVALSAAKKEEIKKAVKESDGEEVTKEEASEEIEKEETEVILEPVKKATGKKSATTKAKKETPKATPTAKKKVPKASSSTKSAVNSSPNGEEVVFKVVEVMPQFPGGKAEMFRYIVENISYPEDAQKEKLEGTVYVGFIINEQGDIKEAKVLKGLKGTAGESCNQEALRVLKSMPQWTPGMQKGKTVKVRYTLPIGFKLSLVK